MQCREAPITQVDVNTPPSLTNPGNQVSNVGVAVNLQVVATDADPERHADLLGDRTAARPGDLHAAA